MLLIYSIELLIAPLSVTVYIYTQFSSNLLHFLVSTTHGPCPSNPTDINPLKKTTWNLGIQSYISTNSNCWLIHHELFSRIKEGATDQEQNAEPPEMLSTAAILSHMKHKPLGLRLLNPCQTCDGPNELSRSNSPSPLFTSKIDQKWTVNRTWSWKAGCWNDSFDDFQMLIARILVGIWKRIIW
jgi:hypothetical protein